MTAANAVRPYEGVTYARALADRLKPHTGVELVTVPGADHIFVCAEIGPLVARSVAFLADRLAA